MFHRRLIIGFMIVMLFCVPSFAIQGDVIPVDDAVFVIDTPTLTATAQTADLQENPTAGISDSLENVLLNTDLKIDDTLLSIGEQNSAPIRAVGYLSNVSTYEKMFTILNTGKTNLSVSDKAGNLATIKNDDGIESLENTVYVGIPDLLASRLLKTCTKGTAQNNLKYGNN